MDERVDALFDSAEPFSPEMKTIAEELTHHTAIQGDMIEDNFLELHCEIMIEFHLDEEESLPSTLSLYL